MAAPAPALTSFLLVSHRKQKGFFNPAQTRLKKSHIRRTETECPLGLAFFHIFRMKFHISPSSKPPRKFYSSNLDYSVEWTYGKSDCLELLMRRGLGYRIIFNMDKRVYDPKDPTTLPDVALTITDIAGTTDKGTAKISRAFWTTYISHDLQPFFQTISG